MPRVELAGFRNASFRDASFRNDCDKAAFEKAAPYLDRPGKHVRHAVPSGAGNRIELIHQCLDADDFSAVVRLYDEAVGRRCTGLLTSPSREEV